MSSKWCKKSDRNLLTLPWRERPARGLRAIRLKYQPMKFIFFTILLLLAASATTAQTTGQFDIKAAERFANLALACVHKEYPNKISHTLNSDADVAPPRKLTPAFYGCYDWHSSVHGHGLLVRLVRTFPNADFAQSAREALRQSLTKENIAQEAAYLRTEGRASFERPYGLAWLLQLVAELREWDDSQAKEMAANLSPLEQAALERLNGWLPKLSNPVRIGEHDQSAFALGLMLDYAHGVGDEKFAALVESKARQFFMNDKDCPLAYEPSGEDFLSPCLGEADLMRRVLPSDDFARWLRTLLPQISASGGKTWLQPVVSPDPSDPKLAHLDGLNLSRAWMLDGIAAGLPKGDKRLPMIMAAAEAHKRAGLAAVTGEHYEGGHWLGSFAVYLVTRRGISNK
ncbi:MAG TPA: DUF2891 domain-containing protein [Terriglobales bacterium]|nr:DUF2891 domain-containing protein [Terriglobales bacterium]